MYASKNRNSLRRRGNVDSGAHWISYSDMMASLLMVFILAVCYSVYQYYNMLAIKTQQLNEQQAELNRAQITLVQREEELEKANVTLLGKQEELAAIQIQLEEKEEDLHAAEAKLAEKQDELDALQIVLSAQREEMDNQQKRIDQLIGVRAQIIQELSVELNRAKLRATVDEDSGDILLDSAVFFETNSYQIKASGQELLRRFLPVYLEVLLQEEYSDYVGEIVIEGHTDTSGSYITNLELSQNRALAVAKFCLQMEELTYAQRMKLQDLLTAKGRSYSDPIYNENGTVNMDASRRVEFKFRLKDAEMIEEMNRILSEDNQ